MKKLSILGKLTCLTLALVMVLTAIPAFGFSAPDLAGHFAANQMQEFYERGFIRTFEDGTLRPNAPMTRAELYSMVNRVFGFREQATVGFVDITPDDWYFQEIARAVAAGYVLGASEAVSLPYNNVTRAEAAVILSRVAGLTPFAAGADQFNDVNPATWTTPYIGAAVTAGLMNGHTDGNFRPEQEITRAEMVIAATRAMDRLGRPMAPPPAPPVPAANVTPFVVDQGPELQQAPFMVNVPPAPAFMSSVPRRVDFGNFAQTIHSSAFGGPLGNRVIHGDVLVDVSSGTIRDLDIRGNLVFSDRTSGTFTLTDIHVSGNIYVFGNPRITMDNSSARELIINSPRNGTSVALRRSAEVPVARLFTTATLTETNIQSGRGFRDVVIENGFDRGARVNLAGRFNRVDVMDRVTLRLDRGDITRLTIDARADRSSVDISSGATVDHVEVNGMSTRFIGSGRIRSTDVRVSGVTFNNRPDHFWGMHASGWWGHNWWGPNWDHHMRVQVVGWGGELLSGAVVEIHMLERGSRHIIASGWTDRNGEFHTWLPTSWWGDDLYRVTVRWGGTESTWNVRARDFGRTLRFDFPGGSSWTGGGSWIPPGTNTRQLTVINAENGTASGSRTVGSNVPLTTQGRAGQLFQGWYVTSGSATIANFREMNASFIMPNAPISIEARWTSVGFDGTPNAATTLASAAAAANSAVDSMTFTTATSANDVLAAVNRAIGNYGPAPRAFSATAGPEIGATGVTASVTGFSNNGTTISFTVTLSLAGSTDTSASRSNIAIAGSAVSHTITVARNGVAGSVAAASNQVPNNGSVAVWATPEPMTGHVVTVNWSISGNGTLSSTSGNSVTVNNITGPVTVTATFVAAVSTSAPIVPTQVNPNPPNFNPDDFGPTTTENPSSGDGAFVNRW